MTCNAAAVRVNSLEAWDQSKQDWAPDQSSWQTQQSCCFAIVPLSLSLHFSSLSAEAWAIFSPGSSFPTAPNHNHPSLVLSLSLASQFIPSYQPGLSLQLNPVYSLKDLL